MQDDLFKSGCPSGYYEEKGCSVSYYNGLTVDEFCCIDHDNECNAMVAEGCAYNDDFGDWCGTGKMEINNCSISHWFNEKVSRAGSRRSARCFLSRVYRR